ncbi:MAG: hypothetical protein AAGA56_05685 [Myxococcota bacterium]
MGLHKNIDQHAADELMEKLTRECKDALREDDGVRPESERIVARVVTSRHLVVTVDLPSPEASVGDEAQEYNLGMLQRIDRDLGIDELQGSPRRFWWFLIIVDRNVD